MRVLLGLFVAWTAGMAACGKEDAAAPAKTDGKPLPDQVISDFTIKVTARGRAAWKMDAVKAAVFEKRNVLEADSVKVTFFDDAGGVRSVLTAAKGTLNRNTDDMEARGDVVVTGSDGIVLRTQSLRWTSQIHQIATEDSVTVIRHEDVLTGWGFRGDADLGKFEILKQMRATIRPARTGAEGTRQ